MLHLVFFLPLPTTRCTPKIGQQIPEPAAIELNAKIMSEAGKAKAKAKADAAKAKADAAAEEIEALSDPADAGLYDDEIKEEEAKQKKAEDEKKKAEDEQKDAEKVEAEKKKNDTIAADKVNRCFENRRKEKECKEKEEEAEKRKSHEDEMETVMETMKLSEGEGEEKWFIEDCNDCTTNKTVVIHKDCCSVAEWLEEGKCHKKSLRRSRT